jgi:hypothetical protein
MYAMDALKGISAILEHSSSHALANDHDCCYSTIHLYIDCGGNEYQRDVKPFEPLFGAFKPPRRNNWHHNIRHQKHADTSISKPSFIAPR